MWKQYDSINNKNKNNMRKGAPLRVGNTLQNRLASKVL